MSRKSDRSSTVRVAMIGLAAMAREPSARIHLAVTVMVLLGGIAAEFDRGDWLWTIVALTLVWVSEAFNTAIERLGDAVSLDHHPAIGVAKDVAAAGVMLCLIGATLILAVVFWPFVLRWVG